MSNLSRALLLPVRRTASALNLPVLIANPFATRRAPLHAPNVPLVLLFTEKAGCTSLTKWFLFQTGRLEAALAFHPSVHRYRVKVLYRQSGYGRQALRLIVSRRKPVIKLVRHPYDRAVSSFLHTLRNAGARAPKEWSLQLIAAARRHAGKPETVAPALSFGDFVRFLASNGTERGQVNGHVARQYQAGEALYIDRIMKLERFKEEIRALEAEFDLPASPLETITASKHHRSGFQRRSAGTGCAADRDITFDQVQTGPLPAYETLYDDECRHLVRACFAADFEAYDYDG